MGDRGSSGCNWRAETMWMLLRNSKLPLLGWAELVTPQPSEQQLSGSTSLRFDFRVLNRIYCSVWPSTAPKGAGFLQGAVLAMSPYLICWLTKVLKQSGQQPIGLLRKWETCVHVWESFCWSEAAWQGAQMAPKQFQMPTMASEMWGSCPCCCGNGGFSHSSLPLLGEVLAVWLRIFLVLKWVLAI